jgi:CheY-like chemotaxis protein
MQKAETLYNCPIIGMTANAFMQDQKRCIDAGMNAYLSKPFSEADLESVVEEYLKK